VNLKQFMHNNPPHLRRSRPKALTVAYSGHGNGVIGRSAHRFTII